MAKNTGRGSRVAAEAARNRQAMRPVTADVQRELADPGVRALASILAERLAEHADDCMCDRWTTHHSQVLAGTVQRLIDAAEKRAAAAALRDAADWFWDDDATTRSLCDQLHDRADDIHPEPIRFEMPSRPSSLRGRAVPPRAAALDPAGADSRETT